MRAIFLRNRNCTIDSNAEGHNNGPKRLLQRVTAERRTYMGWILLFLVLAILFAGLGFGLAIVALKILFYIFVALLLISLIAKLARRV
jgi:uncharacterized membrane protein YtjA (UPF0391 family)